MSLIKLNYNLLKPRLYPKECPLEAVMEECLPIGIIGRIKESKSCYMAGGFVRRWFSGMKQDSDLDLFFKDESNWKECCDMLSASAIEKPIVNQFNSMYSLKVGDDDKWVLKIQAIRYKFYQSIEELFDSFDFTICQFGFDGEHILATEFALLDNSRKRLVPHKITLGVTSLRRIIKYTSQGYYMCTGAATDFLSQVANNPESIDSKVISID